MPAIEALLDTDILVEVLRAQPAAVAWLRSQSELGVGIPVIAWMELLQGARDHAERDRITNRFPAHSLAHLESGDSAKAATWFASFWFSHKVGILDCLIAAIAVRLGVPLYTFNTAHFQVIPGLIVRAPYDRP